MNTETEVRTCSADGIKCRTEPNPWMASAIDPETRLWCIAHQRKHSECHP